MGEESFLHPAQEHGREREALGRVQGHELHTVLTLVGLPLPGLQHRVAYEGGEGAVPVLVLRVGLAGEPILARLPQLTHDFDDFSRFDTRNSLILLSPVFVTPL